MIILDIIVYFIFVSAGTSYGMNKLSAQHFYEILALIILYVLFVSP